jgi:ATP-binding cassette subfamily C (CFTR/MRP) protein 4
VFSHLSMSLCGLTTVRAFRVQDDFQKDFESHLDLHSSASYLFISCVRWLAIVIDWVSLSYIAIVIYGVVLLKLGMWWILNCIVSGDSLSRCVLLDGPEAGLAISSAMGLTSFFQWGVRQSCESENQMISVERILEYTNTEPEAHFDTLSG